MGYRCDIRAASSCRFFSRDTELSRVRRLRDFGGGRSLVTARTKEQKQNERTNSESDVENQSTPVH